MTPMPPAWAMAIARRASVTVSMAEEMIGMFREIVAGDPRGDIRLGRHHFRQPGLQQDVVEGEGLAQTAVVVFGHANSPSSHRDRGMNDRVGRRGAPDPQLGHPSELAPVDSTAARRCKDAILAAPKRRRENP